jgi:hypothetical protein
MRSRLPFDVWLSLTDRGRLIWLGALVYLVYSVFYFVHLAKVHSGRMGRGNAVLIQRPGDATTIWPDGTRFTWGYICADPPRSR